MRTLEGYAKMYLEPMIKAIAEKAESDPEYRAKLSETIKPGTPLFNAWVSQMGPIDNTPPRIRLPKHLSNRRFYESTETIQ